MGMRTNTVLAISARTTNGLPVSWCQVDLSTT
jgi:hypothetical protein